MDERQLWLCSIFSFSRNLEFNPFSPSGLCLNATSLGVPFQLLYFKLNPTSLSSSSNFYLFMGLPVFWHTCILLTYYCLSCTMECKLHGDRVFIVVVFCSFDFDLFFHSVLSPAVFSTAVPGTMETLWTFVKRMNGCFQRAYGMAAFYLCENRQRSSKQPTCYRNCHSPCSHLACWSTSQGNMLPPSHLPPPPPQRARWAWQTRMGPRQQFSLFL